MVFTRPEAASGPYGERMRAHGVDVIAVADEGTGLDLREVFARLGERAVTSVMTEAGGVWPVAC